MYTVTISGFKTREDLLVWVNSQYFLHMDEECPVNFLESDFKTEKVSFENNLNKKNFDLKIKRKDNADNNVL